jgi:hypothetical protein
LASEESIDHTPFPAGECKSSHFNIETGLKEILRVSTIFTFLTRCQQFRGCSALLRMVYCQVVIVTKWESWRGRGLDFGSGVTDS